MTAGSGKRIRVLVVEDSPTVRDILVRILESDARLEVVGTAGDGLEAVEEALRLAPDVVTMDIHMPRMDGLEATRRIMERTPMPIVVVSGTDARNEAAVSFRIMEAGAVATVLKPRTLAGEDVRTLIDTVRLMADVKVIRRWPRATHDEAPPAPGAVRASAPLRVVAVGASTGGPPVLRTLLAGLPLDFPVPVAITQHISPGFTEGFVQWLSQTTRYPVTVACDGGVLGPGRAYVAPDGAHLTVYPDGSGGCCSRLNAEPPENGHCPAVSQLFRSAAHGFGAAAAGVLLTGMGRDGAAELKLMRERGALTIAQSVDSSVVPGMPGAAIELAAASHVLAPEQIPDALVRAVGGGQARATAGAGQTR